MDSLYLFVGVFGVIIIGAITIIAALSIKNTLEKSKIIKGIRINRYIGYILWLAFCYLLFKLFVMSNWLILILIYTLEFFVGILLFLLVDFD